VKGKVYSREIAFSFCSSKMGSGSIVRSSISAFRVEDPCSNPGRSTTPFTSLIKSFLTAFVSSKFAFQMQRVMSLDRFRRLFRLGEEFSLRNVIVVGVASRLLVFASGLIGYFFFPTDASPSVMNLLGLVNLFGQWDAHWYRDIALMGYPASTNQLSGNWAFFPLYPISMRATGAPLFGLLSSAQAVYIGGFLLSNLLFFVTLILFYKISVIVLNNKKFAFVATLFFCFWPGAVFYSAIYSESLFMALALGAFYLFETHHSKSAVVAGFFSALARSNGFLIFVPFAYSGLQTKKYLRAVLQSVIIFLPYLLFNIYGLYTTGLFPIREIVYNHIWGQYRLSLTDVGGPNFGYTALFAGQVLLVVAPFFWFLFNEKSSIKDIAKGTDSTRKDLKYWIFSIYLLVAIAFYMDPKSIQRYALPILPLYWVSAAIWMKNSKAGKAYLLLMGILLFIGSVLFTTGRYYM
jgi:hypothetical protein